jgi:ankyrin repeat protein
VLLLFSKGADVNAKANDSSTPLHFACPHGSTESMSFLVSKGADVHAKNNNGSTPLHYARRYCSTEAVNFLISKVACNTNRKWLPSFYFGIGIFLPLLIIAFCQMKENEAIYKEQGVKLRDGSRG